MSAGNATIESLLSERPICPFQIFVAVLCGLSVLLDGISTQLIGYAAPAISKNLHLAHGQISAAFAAGLFGLMVGGLLCSLLADLTGRRRLLIASTLIFGVFTVATGFAASLHQLVIWRFVAGLGLGGAMPIAIALTAEVSPSRARGAMVLMMFCGFPLGGALAGILAWAILPRGGWHALFFAAGAMSLVLSLVLLVALPESLLFLVNQGASAARTKRLQQRLAPGSEHVTLIRADPAGRYRVPLTGLFIDGRALGTVLIWIIYFMSLLDIYFLASWLPTVLSLNSAAGQSSIIGTSMMQLGGAAGTLILGLFLDRLNPYWTLFLTYLGATVFIGTVGVVTPGGWLVAVLFAAGFFLISAQSGLHALVSAIYPTSARATGLGWGLSIGRIGSIVGPVVGGVLLTTHWDVRSMFFLVAAPTLIAAITVPVMAGARPRTSAKGVDTHD
jgi:MFS transporter, AAHS family, 4-hydroxybenzoate transporter